MPAFFMMFKDCKKQQVEECKGFPVIKIKCNESNTECVQITTYPNDLHL